VLRVRVRVRVRREGRGGTVVRPKSSVGAEMDCIE